MDEEELKQIEEDCQQFRNTVSAVLYLVPICLDNFLDSNLEGYLAKNNVIQEPLKVNVKQGQDNISEHQNYRDWETDRKSTRLNSSHITRSRMPSSA